MIDWISHWLKNIFYVPFEPFINAVGSVDIFAGIIVSVLTTSVFIGSKKSIITTVGAMILFDVFFAIILPVTVLFLFVIIASLLSMTGLIYAFKGR